MVPRFAEEDQMRDALKMTFGQTLLDRGSDVKQQQFGLATGLERHSHAALLQEEQSVEQMDRQFPAKAHGRSAGASCEIQWHAFADRIIELA